MTEHLTDEPDHSPRGCCGTATRPSPAVEEAGCCQPGPAAGPSCTAGTEAAGTEAAGTEAAASDRLDDHCDENERCDEDCIKTAAAIECSIACAEVQNDCCGRESGIKPEDHDELDRDNGHGSDVIHAGQSAHEHRHDSQGRHLDEPCSSHLRAAMEKYATYLESARCICRSVLGNVSRIDRCHAPPSVVAAASASACSTAHDYQRGHGLLISRHHTKSLIKRTKCTSQDLVTKTCGSVDSINEILTAQHPADQIKAGAAVDLEKAAGISHILLNVTGMDCSSCVNNLTRALEAAPGTGNVKVIFINGTAEFDLDLQASSLDHVIQSVHRATGYGLTPFSSDTQTIDVVVSAEAAKTFQENLPRGVEQCEKVSKTTYHVSYDPCAIGARDVLASLDGAELAPPRNFSSSGNRRLARIGASTIAAFILTVPVVVLEWGNPAGVSERTSLIVALVLATCVQAIAVREFYTPALSSLIYAKTVEMDMLVVISITAAYGYSIIAFGLTVAGLDLETKPFFETSSLLIALILLGRLLAAWARKRAVSAVSMRSLQASTAVLVDAATDTSAEIDARLLQFGDTIQIQPHSQIVTDADVLSGAGEVDESMLTGESVPVLKTAGSALVSGTINGAGALTARVSRLPGKNTITDIANLVEQAQSSKPRVQELADKVAGYFIPVVMTAAIIVLVVWTVVVREVRNESVPNAIGTAIGYCIAVLAVSCPCALGLAVPMVLVVAGGVAARGGIIIKTAGVVERGFRVTDVVFDKTGTLTQPKLEVVQEVFFPRDGMDETTLVSLVVTMVKSNKHPVSQAVAAALEKRGTKSIEVEGITSIPGFGVEAEWAGLTVRVGNVRWLQVTDRPEVTRMSDHGLTILSLTVGAEMLAIFGLKSVLRPEAAAVVHELHQRGITVHVVSGDSAKVVEGVARDLGIEPAHVAAERTPSQKQEYVRQLMNDGKTTLFCGDGTNDAVAVAQADVGVQVEASSDVTRATADVVLLSSLEGVVGLLDVSRAAFRRIVFNFVWSAVYNVVAVLLAGGAFVRVRIPPAYAGLGEIVSVMPVIVAALTMPKVKTGMGRGQG